MAKTMTQEAALLWLRANEELLNISEVARRISFDVSNLRKALRGKVDVHGSDIKIPKRCLPELQKIKDELRK